MIANGFHDWRLICWRSIDQQCGRRKRDVSTVVIVFNDIGNIENLVIGCSAEIYVDNAVDNAIGIVNEGNERRGTAIA